MKTSLCISIFLMLFSGQIYSQDLGLFNANIKSRMVRQFLPEEYKQVGMYKVKGNPFYLNGNNSTDLFCKFGVGVDIPLLYDTYDQQLSILIENKTKQVNLEFAEVDSFILKSDIDLGNKAPYFFINASHVGSAEKNYLLRLYDGDRYKLYKSFYAELGSAAVNIAQTNLKEFEITSEYFYVDMKDPNRALIKIKPNNKVLKDAFKDHKDNLALLEKGGGKNRDNSLIAFFESMGN